eukprot:5295238-Prymnesium_polylepis.1
MCPTCCASTTATRSTLSYTRSRRRGTTAGYSSPTRARSCRSTANASTSPPSAPPPPPLPFAGPRCRRRPRRACETCSSLRARRRGMR